MAPRYVALAAAAGAICLQGCFDLEEHTKNFIEFTCGIQVTKLVDSVEEKLNEELMKRCEQMKESFENAQDFLTTDCVDQGAKDIQEGVKETETNYTKECIDRLQNGTEDIKSIGNAISELVNDWTPDLSKIQEHLNSTLNGLQEEAQKKVDEAKEAAQGQLDNAHESISNHLDTEGEEETRLYSTGRLPQVGMTSTAPAVACVAAAALVAMAGLVIFQRRYNARGIGAVYMEQVEERLFEDGELGQ